MRFTILSHAGMLIESKGTKLVTDPWLLGSAYWRSWWNYPKPPDLGSRLDDLDFIYLTHHHWDHFHGPSLRKLPKSARVLIPKAHARLILDDLKTFGFKEIIEIPHGGTVELAPGLRVTSYHFGLSLDSTLVIDDGETVLVNMNDCKISGLPLRQLLKRHPKVDFLFRSHSSASPYPYCVEAEDPEDLELRKSEDYVTEFVAAAELVKPRYAVPFASNHCFLHKDTVVYNDTITSPVDVKDHFDTVSPPGTECVVMVAGDSWDKEGGFTLQGHDAFTFREKYLADYAVEVAPKLEEHYKKEDRAKVDFARFEAFFVPFVRAMPRLMRPVFKPVVVFELTTDPSVHWVVDLARRRVYAADDLPGDWDIVVRTHPYILRDCLLRRMFAVFGPSKRVHMRVARGKLRDLFILIQVLELYEYGYFPVRRMFKWRFLAAWTRRWREVAHYVRIATRMASDRGRDGLAAAVPKVR